MATPLTIHYDLHIGEQPGPEWTKAGTIDVWTKQAEPKNTTTINIKAFDGQPIDAIAKSQARQMRSGF